MKKMVLIHKTPAIWNKEENLPKSFSGNTKSSESEILDFDGELMSLFETDMYIAISKEICNKLGIDELHIVQGFSPNEERNWINAGAAGKYVIDDKTTYWCVTEPKDLLSFVNADLIFTRGNYEKLHSRLGDFAKENESKPIWLHYPATSLMFPHAVEHIARLSSSVVMSNYEYQIALKEQVNGMYVEHNIRNSDHHSSNDTQEMLRTLNSKFIKLRRRVNKGPYDILLVDDKINVEEYSNVYPNSIIYRFVKPIILPNIKLNFERNYDIIFCGTTLQKTKNHMQFITLLKRLDEITPNILKIAIAGDQENIPSFSEGLKRNYRKLIIDNYGMLSRSKLYDLFNESKTMVVLSGRDSNPRVIQEAGILGVRTIAADTMSDGFEILKNNQLIGTVIQTEKTAWFYSRNGNLKFSVNNNFAEKVLKEINRSKSPIVVANICKSLYNLETSLFEIIEIIKSLN